MGKLLENIASSIRDDLWRDEGVIGKTYRRYREIDDAINVRRLAPRIIRILADGQLRTADEIAVSLKPRVALLRYTYGGWGYYYTLSTIERLGDKNIVDAVHNETGKNELVYKLTEKGMMEAQRLAAKHTKRRVKM
jgi:hypothetical protein